MKENTLPFFKAKHNISFAALEHVNKELDRLEKIEVIDYSHWTSPTVSVEKKNNKISVCAGFSMGLNDCLKQYNYPLPSPKEIFSELNW